MIDLKKIAAGATIASALGLAALGMGPGVANAAPPSPVTSGTPWQQDGSWGWGHGPGHGDWGGPGPGYGYGPGPGYGYGPGPGYGYGPPVGGCISGPLGFISLCI